jgi:hypothetical protein
MILQWRWSNEMFKFYKMMTLIVMCGADTCESYGVKNGCGEDYGDTWC